MNGKSSHELSRREALAGSVAALAALMLDASILGRARAQETTLRSDPRYAFVDRISELVIPETDSPGASAAGAAAFVLLALDQGMSGLRPEMLDRVKGALDKSAGGNFMELPENRQTATLADHDQQAYACEGEPSSSWHAWRRVKAAIVAGYYTSEIGASRELVYDPVPGEFQNLTLQIGYRDRSNNGFGGQI